MEENRSQEHLQFPSTSDRSPDANTPTIMTILQDFREKPTGIIITLHEGSTVDKTYCISLSLLYVSNSGPAEYSKKINCTKFTANKFNNPQYQECGMGSSFICPASYHLLDDMSIIHNEILVSTSGIRDVELIYPFANRSSDAAGTSSQSNQSSHDPDSGVSKTQSKSQTSEVAATKYEYVEPGIINVLVCENKIGTAYEVRIELQNPVIRVQSNNATQATNTEEPGASQAPGVTSQQTNIYPPPFIIKYLNIRNNNFHKIVHSASASTHPEIFPYNEEQQNFNVSPQNKSSRPYIKAPFSIKFDHVRRTSRMPDIYSNTAINLNTKLYSYTTSMYQKLPFAAQPGGQKWTLNYNRYLRARLLTDVTGIKGICVNYINWLDHV